MILAMENTEQNFMINADLLVMSHFWQRLFPPIYPVLADICQISILFVKKAILPMFDIIAYQVLKKTTPSQTQTFQPFASFLKDDRLASFDIKAITEFKYLPQLESAQKVVFEQFLPKNQQIMIFGFLIAKTGLSKQKIHTLLAWTTFLSLKLLHDFCSSQRTFPLTEKQLNQWRDYQVFALNTPSNHDVKILLDFDNQIGMLSSQYQATTLVEQAHIQKILQNMLQFVEHHPFNKPLTSHLTEFSQGIRTTQPSPALTMAQIAIQPVVAKKLSWLDYLQKYWIATSIVFSGLVFGVMNVLMPDKNNAQLVKPLSMQISQEKQDDKKRYHDVAIVKIASEVADTKQKSDNASTKKSEKTATKSQESDKKIAKNKNTDQRSADKKTVERDKTNAKNQEKLSTKNTSEKKVVEKKSNKADDKKTSEKETTKKSDKPLKSEKNVPNRKNETTTKTDKPANNDKKVSTQKPQMTQSTETKSTETKQAKPEISTPKTTTENHDEN